MKQIAITLLFVFFPLYVLAAGEQADYLQLVGKVTDASNSRPIHYASVNLSGTDISNVSNPDGVFSLKLAPGTYSEALVTISHLGYATLTLKVSDFNGYSLDNPLPVKLLPATLALDPAVISAQDPLELMKAALYKIKSNYPTEHVGMTAFYREIVKKGSNKYLTMNEAVLDIDKAPYGSYRNDRAGIRKGRGSQNYDSTDTLFIKYQGGVMSIFQIDQVKNPFAAVNIQDLDKYYRFRMEPSEMRDQRVYYVVSFNQDKYIDDILMRGRVCIDSESLAIGRIEMSMNVEGRKEAASLFVLKRPQDTQFDVESAEYIVNYKLSGNTWYYDYARAELKFKTRKKRSLFRNSYTVMSEIAITDHSKDVPTIENEARIRFKDQMTEKVSAFLDPNFWENYNVIEPDTDIEAIVRKIVRQLRKHNLE